MEKTKIEAALALVQAKLATGGTWYGHDVEQVEKALEEAVALEKAPVKASKSKKESE